MNMIFLGRKHGRPMRLHLTPRVLAVAGSALMVFSMLMGAGAWWLTSSLAGNSGAAVASSDQRQQEALQAMSLRMADIQARMMRIDALGAHLAEQARLKGETYDFSSKPPMGGPEQPMTLPAPKAGQVDRSMSSLSQTLQWRESQLVALDNALNNLRDSHVRLDNMPVHDGYITSQFGYRPDPLTGRTAFHGGIDFAGNEGSDVFVVADGVVTWAGPRTGYGNLVEVRHGGGWVTRYAHARAVAVKVGDVVGKDQLVAYMGSTGRSTGTHLHYEVLRDGRQVDPASFLRMASR